MAIRMDMASKMYSSFSRRSGYYAANSGTSCRESCRSAKNHVLRKTESTTILWGLQRSGNEHQVFHDLCQGLSLIHISEPTRLGMISYAVFCLKKKKKKNN